MLTEEIEKKKKFDCVNFVKDNYLSYCIKVRNSTYLSDFSIPL